MASKVKLVPNVEVTGSVVLRPSMRKTFSLSAEPYTFGLPPPPTTPGAMLSTLW